MLISKIDLYKTEWLDLVFAKRNKEYGAYYLRQHNAENTLKAIGIMIFGIISFLLILGALIKAKPEVLVKITDVPLTKYTPSPTVHKAEIKKAKPAAAKPLPPVTTTKYVPMVVTDKPVTLEPPKMAELANTAIGTEDIKIPGNGGIGIDAGNGKGGDATEGDGIGKGMELHDVAGLDVMPEPYGGADEWAKFLRKNLKYPPQAIENQLSGRVWISFIIEKDGHLSNIIVDRGAGSGMDEEALRVLKLSKAWKPGFQNGRSVRVKFIMPIAFSINQ